MFYIVDKLKEQAKRWELKAGQSAESMFYILRGRLVKRGRLVGRGRLVVGILVKQLINLNL